LSASSIYSPKSSSFSTVFGFVTLNRAYPAGVSNRRFISDFIIKLVGIYVESTTRASIKMNYFKEKLKTVASSSSR